MKKHYLIVRTYTSEEFLFCGKIHMFTFNKNLLKDKFKIIDFINSCMEYTNKYIEN